jgi:iron complex outermembrane receptor protein
MKRVLIICAMILLHGFASAQNKLSGKITDQFNVPLVGAAIFVPEMAKGTLSDVNGNYELLNLPKGLIKVQFSYLGYASRIETVKFDGSSVNLDISLKQTAIEAEEIVVSGGYNSSQHDNAVKIDILKLNTLTIESTPNFTEVLTKVPGVDMISKGNGVSKPVIRGLSMNDILVLNNGVRFENYQYSSHHPLGIDEFGIGSVEIIKGPASLLFGSDAIGGVINFVKEKPAAIGSVVGDYNVHLYSNTLGMTNNLGIKAASKNVFGGFRIGQKTNADFLQGGGDFAPNTRFNELSVKANVGFTNKIGSFKLFYDFNNQKLGLAEDEAIDSINKRGRENKIWYQDMDNHLLSSRNKIYFGLFKLDLNSAYQTTVLSHITDEDNTEIQMKLATLTYEAKLHFQPSENSEYIMGFQGFNQKNTNLNNRETKLLPDAYTNNYSVFGLFQYTFFNKLEFQTGVRYDSKTISTEPIGLETDTLVYRKALDKYFGSFSGSAGATYKLSESLLFRANYAVAFRTPNLAELTSKGQHELRFELGDPELIPENAYETDLSVHYHINNITFDIAAFYNIINNYIFISPTGDITLSGIPVYKYKQSDSYLYGGEAGVHYHPTTLSFLHLEMAFSTVVGKQDNGDYLPFVPADKLRFEIRAEKKKCLFLHDSFISLSTHTAFNQNNAAPDETVTAGYTLVNVKLGARIQMKNQIIALSLSANNLFDKKYIDHLSTLKEVDLYNPGRNISINLKIPFGINLRPNNN